MANELGFFDFLDTGDDRDPITTARDTASRYLDTARELLPGD